ncbi:MAG: ABC transporter permease, partial [Ilumatobacteraceae bacterium]
MTVLNPVLGRELKERMRGVRSFAALAIFLALLILTTWIVYRGNQQTDPFSFDLARQTRVGRELYEWILSIMLVLVLFFVPGLTAGAIAGERERQTLLPLQVTLLRPRSIVWGKVLAALAYLALMIVAALPLFAVAYQLGGIT